MYKLLTWLASSGVARLFGLSRGLVLLRLTIFLNSCRVTSSWSLVGCLYSRQDNGFWRRINYQIFILQQISGNLVGIWMSRNLELLARVRVLY